MDANNAPPEYHAWRHMRARCLNPKHKQWKDYGGRGITICERWSSFANFIADMGLKPSPGLSLERMDNDGHYCHENCKWATPLEQARNQRPKKSPVRDKCLAAGVNLGTYKNRKLRGWTEEQALTPVKRKQK